MIGNSELYNAIFSRKSVRRYDMAPLNEVELNAIESFFKGVKRLDPDIKTDFTIISGEQVKGLLGMKFTMAPHFIFFYSEQKDDYAINTGFMLQQLDLYLSSIGLGCCWLGIAKPQKEIELSKDGLKYVIMLAFGKSAEPVHRRSSEEFKRLEINEISFAKGVETILEPVRLAPSAGNSQPWLFTGDVNKITVCKKKVNLIKAQLYGKMNYIDIGIALCHLWLSIENQSKSVEFDFTPTVVPDNSEFMVNVKIKG